MADLIGGHEGRQAFAALVEDVWWDEATGRPTVSVSEARTRAYGYLGQLQAGASPHPFIDIPVDVAVPDLSAEELSAVAVLADVYAFFELPIDAPADAAGSVIGHFGLFLRSGELLCVRLVDDGPAVTTESPTGVDRVRRLARLAVQLGDTAYEHANLRLADSNQLPMSREAILVDEALRRAASGERTDRRHVGRRPANRGRRRRARSGLDHRSRSRRSGPAVDLVGGTESAGKTLRISCCSRANLRTRARSTTSSGRSTRCPTSTPSRSSSGS
jgi:hypothetical protein